MYVKVGSGASSGDWIAIGAIVDILWQKGKVKTSAFDQLCQVMSKAILFDSVQSLVEQKTERVKQYVVHVGEGGPGPDMVSRRGELRCNCRVPVARLKGDSLSLRDLTTAGGSKREFRMRCAQLAQELRACKADGRLSNDLSVN